MLRTLCSLRKCLKSLTKIEMDKRTRILAQNQEKGIKYDFNLSLHQGKQYHGLSRVLFSLNSLQFAHDELFLDFQGKSVSEVVINGQVDPENIYDKDNGRVILRKELLKKGENTVYLRYQNQYDNDGSGCVSFTDVDGQQYLYTQFEPYMANRVFPIFDQPNLKGKMNLSLDCPPKWQTVLSNQHPKPTTPLIQSAVCNITRQIIANYQKSIGAGYKTTSFHETKLLPSYLYCFVVGPYKKYTISNTHRNIPMDLYCIESLAPHLKTLTPFIAEITNKAMEFFEQYFGYPYPFEKYDQVFAHEYKWGAMENAGIVTLNDLYVFKHPVPTEKMLSFGNTVVHELAHHWFGNLVTMKWWDDLWLNESFAEYISHYCLEKIKPSMKTIQYESAMISFFSRKGWGYNEDELTTTHPIRSPVANTHIAESIFDGITYSKGAATMKQLMYLMGEENFSKALADYFNKYAFKNAELDDLLRCMERYYSPKSTGITLEEWKNMWLETSSLNQLSYEVGSGKELVINQKPFSDLHQTLRTHKIKIGFVQKKNNKLEIESREVLVQPQEKTVITFDQKDKNLLLSPAILLNHEDLSFAKSYLSEKSQEFLEKNLCRVEDSLFRSLVWKSFFDMVKDAKTKSSKYIQLIIQNLSKQSSDPIFEEHLTFSYMAINKYTPQAYRSQLFKQMREFCLSYLIQGNYSKNREIILKQKLVLFTSQQEQMRLLIDWFQNKENCPLNKISLDIGLKWKVIVKVLGSEFIKKEEKEKLLKEQCVEDKSDTMINKKHTCDGLLLELQQMKQVYESYLKGDKWSMTSLTHSMIGFNNKIHEQHIKQLFMKRYFEDIHRTLTKKQNYQEHTLLLKDEMLEIFIDYLDPVVENTISDLKQKTFEFKKIQGVKNDKLAINLRKKIDQLEKRIRCYSLYE